MIREAVWPYFDKVIQTKLLKFCPKPSTDDDPKSSQKGENSAKSGPTAETQKSNQKNAATMELNVFNIRLGLSSVVYRGRF